MLTTKQKRMIIAYYYYNKIKRETKNKRLYWIHPIIQEKNEFGGLLSFTVSCDNMKKNFVDYFRMKMSTFDKLLISIENNIRHENTKMRESIPPYIRLAITLR